MTERSHTVRVLQIIKAVIAEPMTIQEISAQCGTKEDTARRIVAVLGKMDLIEPQGTQWRPQGCRPIVWRWKK